MWSVIGGSIVNGGTVNDNNIHVIWDNSSNGLIQVNYNDGNGCSALNPSHQNIRKKFSPVVISQSKDSSVCLGNTANFNVVATGTGKLSYQWQKESTVITGDTSASFTIDTTRLINAGNYTCTVTAGCGSVTSNTISLSFKPATVITNQPTDQMTA
jgi:hypothetical protein